MNMNTNKTILIIGDGGVGKTSYITRLENDTFTKVYNPTTKVTLHKWNEYCIIDTEGQHMVREVPFTEHVQGIILMFDLSSVLSYRNTRYWYKKITENYNVPIVLCGNKSDIKSRKIKVNKTKYDKYIEISTRHGISLTQPLTAFNDLLNN